MDTSRGRAAEGGRERPEPAFSSGGSGTDVPLELTHGPPHSREWPNVVERLSHALVAPGGEGPPRASEAGDGDGDGDGEGEDGVSPLWCVFQQALEHKVG